MFTISEKESRYRGLARVLDTDNLKALILVGDTSVGPELNGDLRYFTNYPVIFYRHVVVAFSNSKPVMFLAGNGPQKEGGARGPFVDDCRGSNHFLADVANLLKERGVFTGRIGVSFEMLPTAWYISLNREFPQVEWVEIHERMMQIRFQRSREEANIYREGAALADGSFEAAVKFIRAGVNEHKIVAEIERYARAHGAEENFTLIGSGKFAMGDSNRFPRLHPPSDRRIEIGDTIEMEITPRYQGYWTQLARRVNVGTPNGDVEKIKKAGCEALAKGLEQFKPGKTIAAVASAIESYVAKCGYQLRSSIGHICGIDLVESLVKSQNQMKLTPGTAVILHPRLFTPDGKSNSFWGETYLVTEDGYERLNRTGDDVLTVGKQEVPDQK